MDRSLLALASCLLRSGDSALCDHGATLSALLLDMHGGSTEREGVLKFLHSCVGTAESTVSSAALQVSRLPLEGPLESEL